MASSLLSKLYRPSLLTQLVSCERVNLGLKLLRFVTPNYRVLRAGVSSVDCGTLGKVGDGDQAVLQRWPGREHQSLPGSEQEGSSQ